ncbi:MAG: RluA family pseudouridine synthase [Pseudomonadota bacterium]
MRDGALVTAALAGQRADRVAAASFPDYSRSLLKRWMDAGWLTLDGQPVAPKHPVYEGQIFELAVPASAFEQWDLPQPVPFRVVYEDADLLVVDKPAGVVVHPGAGNRDGTLVNGLLHHRPALARLPRAGIVHRLDKNTTGLLIVAASLAAHTALVQMIAERAVRREYEALCEGSPPDDGWMDSPIGRDPRQPLRMAVVASGRPARTHLAVAERFAEMSWLRLTLDTGRTHQIRVHLAHHGHPLVGDHLYGARSARQWAQRLKGDAAAVAVVSDFARQALHARRLRLDHPVSGEALAFDAPLPSDLRRLREAVATLNGA